MNIKETVDVHNDFLTLAENTSNSGWKYGAAFALCFVFFFLSAVFSRSTVHFKLRRKKWMGIGRNVKRICRFLSQGHNTCELDVIQETFLTSSEQKIGSMYWPSLS